MSDRLFIVTESYRLADERARQLGLPRNQYVAITGMHDAEKLMGVENPRVERYGPGPQDLVRIEELIRSRTRNTQ